MEDMFSLSQDWSRLLAVAFLLLLPCALTYVLTSLRWFIALRSRRDGREPPTIPYMVPFLGHAISVARDIGGFVDRTVYVLLARSLETENAHMVCSAQYGISQPMGILVGAEKMFIVADPSQNEILLRSSKCLDNKSNIILVLRNIFGTPDSSLEYYHSDDSGSSPKPLPGSNVKPEYRVLYQQHRNTHIHLTGASLSALTEQLVARFDNLMKQARFNENWTDLPDFWLFFRDVTFQASVEALFGEHLLALTPDLRNDFWEFDRYALTCLKGLPRWMSPRAYAVRDRVLAAIQKWLTFAQRHVDATELADAGPEWDPYWGSRMARSRQGYMAKMPFMTAEARAAEYLGILFASNGNAIPASAWMTLYTFLDPHLLGRVRQEIEDSREPPSHLNGQGKLDAVQLCSKPLLQSIYAETLRLNTGIVIGRTPRDGPFKVGEWTYPKDSKILSLPRTAAMDSSRWNTGNPENSHPVDTFWADRFIVYPDDASSGPLKKPSSNCEKARTPEFSLRGLSGSWFPYGGGTPMCPGRHFAKQEMIVCMAVLAASYDIELKAPEGFAPQPDLSYFPVSLVSQLHFC